MELYRDVSPGQINLADIAGSLDYEEKEAVAESMDGYHHSLRVSPSYAFRASAKEEDLFDAVELSDADRSRAEDVLERKEDPDNFSMSLPWTSTAEDILDTFDRYEDADDPHTVSKPEYRLLNKMKAEARGKVGEEDSPKWAEKVRTKNFPGLGEFQQIADNAYKTVYAGPVDGEFEHVVYAPNSTYRPDVFDDQLGESLVHVLAMQQNTERLKDDGRTPVSDFVQPFTVNLHGEPYAVALAEYRDMRDVPEEDREEASELAQELEQDIKDGRLYYHSTFNPNASQEFAKAGLRMDNIRFTSEDGIVVADLGEGGEASIEEVREILGEENMEKIRRQRAVSN